MKKNALMVFLAVALMLVIGIAGSAFSEGTATVVKTDSTAMGTAQNCAAHCPKFVDANKDGVCDSMAVHHKDGKCTMMEQCKKDGKCTGNCKNHMGAAGATGASKVAMPAGCDPTKCMTGQGGCPMKGKTACPGAKK